MSSHCSSATAGRRKTKTPSTIRKRAAALGAVLALGCGPAFAGPPYLTDDPVPTDLGAYEIYLYGAGTLVPGGADSEAGIDFNYGAAPNLQLTLEASFATETNGKVGIANVALAAKYRFLTQDSFGLDVAIFPHLVLPSASSSAGDGHMSLFLPLWVQQDFGPWSVFGGGGCSLSLTRGANNFCEAGAALTREVIEGLRVGGEIFYSGAQEPGGKPNTALGIGATWDLSDHHHLLAYWGPNLRYPTLNRRSNFYAALLFTF